MAVTNVSQRISQPHLLEKKNRKDVKQKTEQLNQNKSSFL